MDKKNTFLGALINGLLFENPTFVLMVGMCPTLAVTTAASNAIGMGLSTTVVLVCSNLFISLLRTRVYRGHSQLCYHRRNGAESLYA